MKHYVSLAIAFFSLHSAAQCDLEILAFDPVAPTITVAFNNTTSCGGAAGPTGIAELQFGFQALDSNCNALNQGWDFPWGLSIPGDNNHPGWVYSATTTLSPTNWTNLDVWEPYNVDPPYYAGDTITFPLGDFYQSGGTGLFANLPNVFDFWLSQGLEIQAVIWQISYGPTMYAADGGWAEVGINGDGTGGGGGLYEDSNWQDNWVQTGDCSTNEDCYEIVLDTVFVEVVDTLYITITETDTIYINLVDTVYVSVVDTIYINTVDTLYIELEPDTVYITEVDTFYVDVEPDTVYVPLPSDTVFQTTIDTLTITETITEYIYVNVPVYDTVVVFVDCETGLPCIEQPRSCEVYVPNAFTPDNDGYNDGWKAVTDATCWDSFELTVRARSGERVFYSTDPEEWWDGSHNGSDYYVQDGMYIWYIIVESPGYAARYTGHVTLVR